ncbi:MAG TPA: amino acid adenylation domain-containing protein, partial [Desulfobacteraceae bacterium]|nr:amino acid adenylation domain-containing protein [Desulfobacteraceae bacterium]
MGDAAMLDATHADLSLNDPQELSGLFSKCADMTPNNIAVVHNREMITYKELDILSNRYADYLHQAHHIERGDLVCVAYERGINFIVAILSILKCGAAYVPIDTKEPAERRRDIIDDVAPKLLLVQPKHRGDFDFPNCVSLDDLTDIYTFSPAPRQTYIHSQDLACVFFTSGSTGRPKGVLLPHLALSGLVRSPRYLTITPDDRVLSSSSIAFDAASFEIWTALANSATLVCIDYETIINPEAFATFLDQQDISVMWITSALFDQVVDFRPGMFKKVKYLLSGGDVVNPKTVYKVLNNDQGRPKAFINGYGPTETGILATFQMITEMHSYNEPLSIGKALADTVLYVLDEKRQPVPPGEQGELYIGGHRLAKGYLNLPERTAQTFIQNPFTGNPTDILYRTGDLVRFRPDGSLEFTGRADRQIKFRGFRLELDGIENV